MTNGELFEPQIVVQTLARDIVVVARTRSEGTWKAYIGTTDEWSHPDATSDVLERGTAVRERVARAIFPQFKELPYAR